MKTTLRERGTFYYLLIAAAMYAMSPAIVADSFLLSLDCCLVRHRRRQGSADTTPFYYLLIAATQRPASSTAVSASNFLLSLDCCQSPDNTRTVRDGGFLLSLDCCNPTVELRWNKDTYMSFYYLLIAALPLQLRHQNHPHTSNFLLSLDCCIPTSAPESRATECSSLSTIS